MKPRDYYDGVNQAILNVVPKTARCILEVGCANGELGAQVIQSRGCEYWGIELDESASAAAKQRLTHVLNGDIEALDLSLLPLDHFDCLIFGDTLEHLVNPESVLVRLKPHLKIGAHLIASVPNIGHWTVVLELLHGEFEYGDSGLLDRTHRRFFTPASLRKALWRCGFTVKGEGRTLLGSTECDAIVRAASDLGVGTEIAARGLSTYQVLAFAEMQPDLDRQPEKRELLLRSRVPLSDAVVGKLSVVIVTFQSESTIEECLLSVLGSLTESDEVIVVDNDSSDGTCEKIEDIRREWPQIQLRRMKSNLGYARAANTGVHISSGEYIVLANPDVTFVGDWKEAFVEVLELPGCGAVGPISDRVMGRQSFAARYDHEASAQESAEFCAQFYREVEETAMLIGFCIALKRETLSECGLLDEALYLGADDLELSWRLRTLGLKLFIALDVFVEHRHGVSFSAIAASTAESQVRASDLQLRHKLSDYYGGIQGLSSVLIWDHPVFDAVLLA
ncbi:MAG: glycosyltransferase [Fimbriimonadaceae bacterium]|nr:glycosyltransferase [Fimbriimonadaceae bacterium]